MAKMLSDEDGRAVDLLLDSKAGSPIPEAAGYMLHAAVSADRVKSVERILALLAEFRPIEPPADLVSRTLHRINSAVGVAPSMPPSNATGPRPVA